MSFSKLVGLSLMCASAGLFSACETNKPAQPRNWNEYEARNGSTGLENASGPAAGQPAPKLAPMAMPALPRIENTGRGLALPTGDRNTSVLLVEKLAPVEVNVGQPFDYEVRVTNLTNSQTLDNVVVMDMFPANFRMTTSSVPSAAGTNGWTNFNVGELAPHESKSFKVTGSASAAGTLNNCVTASYMMKYCVQTAVVAPALKVVKTAPAEVTTCDIIPIKITVTNTGTGMARNIKVSDSLASGLTVDGKSSVDMDAGSLAAGQSRDFMFNARASKTGSYTNTAKATADGGMSADSNSTTTVVRQPALGLKLECPGNLLIGRNLTYKLTVTNTGDAVANGTMVSASLPGSAAFVSADNGGMMGGGGGQWNVGSLKPGESRTLTLVARSTGAGEIPVHATATAVCAQQVTADCKSMVAGVPDIGTSISDDTGVVQIPNPHTFTMTMKNQGQIDLTNVKVSASLADGLQFVSTSLPSGSKVEGGNVVFNVGTLRAGQIMSFTIVCKGSKEGELVIRTETTSDQTKLVRNDEQVNYVNP